MNALKKIFVSGCIFFILFTPAKSQYSESIEDYKIKGDNAYNNNLFKKAFEYYTEYLINNLGDSIYTEKAAISGFYCQRNNTLNEQIAELTPIYYRKLTNQYERKDLYKDQAKSNFLTGLYFSNEAPYKASGYFYNCMNSIDSLSLFSNLDIEQENLHKESYEKFANTLIYATRHEAYNKLVDNISDFIKSNKTDEKVNLMLLVKLNVLNGYLESENPLIFEGEHHFVNKTVEDIQNILKDFDSETLHSYFSPICFFLFNNFKSKNEISDFRIQQAKGIKIIADERKIKAPSEEEKLVFWEEYSKKEQLKNREALIKKYGDQTGILLYNKDFQITTTPDMILEVLGVPILKRNFSIKQGEITVLLYQNEKQFIFLNNVLHLSK